MDHILFEKLVVKKITCYGTWRFITMFTRAHHLSLSWVRWIKSTSSCPVSLILSSHLHLRLPSSFFPWSFSTKIMYAFLISPKNATFPACLIFLNFITSSNYHGMVWYGVPSGSRCRKQPPWKVTVNRLNMQSQTADNV